LRLKPRYRLPSRGNRCVGKDRPGVEEGAMVNTEGASGPRQLQLLRGRSEGLQQITMARRAASEKSVTGGRDK
jgi:hypothetical protein